MSISDEVFDELTTLATACSCVMYYHFDVDFVHHEFLIETEDGNYYRIFIDKPVLTDKNINFVKRGILSCKGENKK